MTTLTNHKSREKRIETHHFPSFPFISKALLEVAAPSPRSE